MEHSRGQIVKTCEREEEMKVGEGWDTMRKNLT